GGGDGVGGDARRLPWGGSGCCGSDGVGGGDDGVKVMRVVYGGEWVVRGAAMVRQRRCGCRRGWAARGRK
ncbi:hypothetical protein Tco_1330783, partial [Tanacetum coccineum]